MRPTIILCILTTLFWATPAQARHPLEPELVGEESYAETFMVMADLDNGAYVQLQLGISNLGAGDGKAACRILVVQPNGKPFTAVHELSRDEWAFSKKPVPQLNMGPCSAFASNRTEIRAQIDDAMVRIMLESPLRPVDPPGSRIEVDGSFYHYRVLVPSAAAQVEMVLPGQAPALLDGRGYADRFRSTTTPKEAANRWIRFRALDADHSLLFLARQPEDEEPFVGWSWPTGNSHPTAITPISLTKNGKGWVVSAGSDAGDLRIRSGKTLFRYAPVEQYGFVGTFARVLVGNPVTTTYRAELSRPGKPKVKGILEISHVE